MEAILRIMDLEEEEVEMVLIEEEVVEVDRETIVVVVIKTSLLIKTTFVIRTTLLIRINPLLSLVINLTGLMIIVLLVRYVVSLDIKH